MRLFVLGATGRTGTLVVDRALAEGHEVTAAVRRPDAITVRHPMLEVVPGNVTDAGSMAETMAGADAVCSVLGASAPRRPTRLYSDSVAAIVEAMGRVGVRRIVTVTAIPAEPDALKTAFERVVVHRVLHLFFGGGYDDMVRMEQLLADSDTDWTVLRPPRLTNASPVGRYRTAIDQRLPGAGKLPRADLAQAILDTLANSALVGHAVNVAT